MAISFIQQQTVNDFLPVGNPINITVDSNNNGKCNFRYVCDVYVNATNVFRFKLFPDPSTGYGFFQLSSVLSDYLSAYLDNTNTAGFTEGTETTIASDGKSAITVYCSFGEEYDSSTDCDGTITIYPGLTTSNSFTSYYGAFDYKDWPSYNSSDYNTGFTQSADTKFLTNRPRTNVDCSFNDSYYLDILGDEVPEDAIKLNITLSNGFTYSIASDVAGSGKRFRATCGPYDINKYHESPIISSSIKWYDIQLYNTDYDTNVSESFRINVIKPKTFRTRLGFIGLLGSPEYVTFYHRNLESYDIVRGNYEKYLTSNKGSGLLTYEVGDRQLTTYSTKATERHLVTTFVDRYTSSWLYEMWISPNVWVEDRPRIVCFDIVREDATATSRMLIKVKDPTPFVVGDYIYCIPDDDVTYEDYLERFQIVGIDGDYIDCGLTYNIYSLLGATGWIVREENGRMIPIIVDDTSVDVKQRTAGLIQYSLTYKSSANKNTLR